MAELRYDISQAFNAAFGAAGKLAVYDTGTTEQPVENILFPNAEVITIDESNVKSYLGTPIIFPITFLGGTYNYYSDGQIKQKELQDLQLPATTMVDFRRSKIKRKTRVNGGNGSIKETYGLDDWKIRIRGLILPEASGDFPEETLLRLQEFENLADSIRVSGKLFRLLSIYKIDIDEITLPQVKGYPNNRPFMLSCESTEPVELILK
ncbi:MAG: DUF6046 domain-containing protein [Flavobacteriales bacterium]|jgi:hypothetical protein|nr:DUF6046 domain-containing protein [Flavobacteriales bacterium]